LILKILAKCDFGTETKLKLGEAGLPNVVAALAIDPTTPTTLYAASATYGVFSIQQIAACSCDCNASGSVTVDKMITLVNIALGTAQPAPCSNRAIRSAAKSPWR
jgi:hypothetical protein